jgi:hypothetical protein
MLGVAKALLVARVLAALDAETVMAEAPVLTATPNVGNLRTEPTLSEAVTPSAGIQSTTTQGIRFAAQYAPRALWRQSDSAPTGADPLLLHQLNLTYRPFMRLPTTLELQLNGTIGDVDMAAQGRVFTTNQTAPLNADLRLYSVVFTSALQHSVGMLWFWQLSVPLVLQGPLGSQEALSAFALRESRSVGAIFSVGRKLNSTQSLLLSLNTQFAQFADTTSESATMLLGWQAQLSRTTSTSLGAGGGWVHASTSETTQPMAGGLPANSSTFFGAGNATVTRTREHGADSVIFTLDARADPFTQALRPTASLVANSSFGVSKHVTVAGNLGASTVTSLHALPSDQNETGINAALTTTWAGQVLAFRFGLRGSLRGPNLDPDRTEPFRFRERLLAAFIGVHWGITRQPR